MLKVSLGSTMLLLPSLCSLMHAQSSTLTPAQAAQQTVYGVCSYVQAGTTYYTNDLTAPMSATSQIQVQFQRYVTTLTPAAARRVNRCNWALTQAEIQKGEQLITSSVNAKFSRFSWQYDASAIKLPASSGSTTTSAAAAPVRAATASASNAVASVPQTASAAAVNSATSAANTTTASAGGLGSIGTNMQQTAQSAQSTVTNSANTAVTSSVNDMTNAATNAVGNLFKRKPKQAAAGNAAAAAAPAQQVAAATPPAAPAGAAAPQAAVAAGPAAGSSNELVFLVCHLVASGSEYYSGVFPAQGAEQPNAAMGFWRQVARQYSLSNVPFSNNVACDRSATDQQANAALQTLKSTASQRGAAKTVDTGWAYMGDGK